jgi:transposase
MANKDRILSSIKLKDKNILEDFYHGQKLSTHEIAKRIGVTHEAVRYWMIKYNINRRKPNSVSREKHKISKKLLEDLYLKKKIPTTAIAKKFNIKSHSTIVSKLMKYGIPLRTMSEAKMKYKKKSFSENLNEKSYLMGLRTGDLSAHKNGLQVRIGTATTHLAQINMFKKIFSKYSHIYVYPFRNKLGQKELQICCDLDKSFEFLLEKINKIPIWIFNNDDYFFSFLAGYSDAEGSFDIFENTDNTITFHYRIASNDEIILKQILNKLKSKGFSCKLYLHAKKGKRATYGVYSKNVYALRMFRKNDVLKFVNILKSKSHHEEKMKRMQLISTIEKHKKWSQVKEQVQELQKEISELRIR